MRAMPCGLLAALWLVCCLCLCGCQRQREAEEVSAAPVRLSNRGAREAKRLPSRDNGTSSAWARKAPGASSVIAPSPTPVPNLFTIRGMVVTPQDTAASSATVQIALSRSDPSGIVLTSDKDGCFETTVTQAALFYVSACMKPYSPSGEVVVDLRETSSPKPLCLVLRPMHFLAGRIRDEQGHPVGGVKVHAVSWEAGDGAQGDSVSDALGSYRIEGLGEGNVYVGLSHPTYGDQAAGETAVDRDDADFVFKEAKRVFTGKVVDYKSGLPVTGFSVTTTPTLVAFETPALSPGEFIGRKMPWSFRFRIEAPGYAPFDSREYRFTPDETSQSATFELGPGANVHGCVVDAVTGRAMEGVEVRISAYGWSDQSMDVFCAAKTSADGTFSLHSTRLANVSLGVYPQLPWTMSEQTIELDQGTQLDCGRIELSLGATISGQVVNDVTGQGVAGVEVRASVGQRRGETFRTGAQGEFLVQGVAPGVQCVWLPSCRLEKRVVCQSGQSQRVIFQLGSGTIQGKIRSGGKPCRASVEVELRKPEFGAQGEPLRGTLGYCDGSYRAEKLCSGEWVVRAREGSAKREGVVRVRAGSVVEKDFDIPVDSQLSGNVTDEQGNAVEGAVVMARNVDPEQAGPVDRPAIRRVATIAKGKFFFASLPVGTYRVTAQHGQKGCCPEMKAEVLPEGKSKPLHLKLLPNGGSIRSLTLAMKDGRPLRNAQFRVLGESGWEYRAQPRDRNGVAELTQLPAGHYHVQVGGDYYTNVERDVEIKPGESIQLEDVLEEAGVFRWRIYSKDGQEVQGLPCTVEPEESSSIMSPRNATTEKSVATFHGLLPGFYRATVFPPGQAPQSLRLEIRSGEFTEKETVLESPKP